MFQIWGSKGKDFLVVLTGIGKDFLHSERHYKTLTKTSQKIIKYFLYHEEFVIKSLTGNWSAAS